MFRTFRASAPILAAAALFFAVAPAAHGVEALSTEELASHCAHYAQKPDSEDGIFCIRYVQGFIDGAAATDERVTLNVADEIDKRESFTDRAMRTRLGRQLERFGPSYYADFCLGEPVPLAQVVERVIADLADPERRAESDRARDVVFHTLRDAYPCKAADDK